MATFADMLSYLRKRNDLSQKELAEKTGLTRSAIGMYETGKREPDFETLELFADFFNVNMDTLLGKAAPPTPVTGDGLSADAREVAQAYETAQPHIRFGVRKLLDLDMQDTPVSFAARVSDRPRGPVGPDTDVDI